jgi:hypothetical protein
MESTIFIIGLGTFIFGSLIGLMVIEMRRKDGDN